jgi:hypothetical protein
MVENLEYLGCSIKSEQFINIAIFKQIPGYPPRCAFLDLIRTSNFSWAAGDELMNVPCWIQRLMVSIAITIGLSACSTPTKLSTAELESIGLHEGAKYWEVEQRLAQRGYGCYVSGAKRENFDCTRSEGVFPTCLLRIVFIVDDKNLVSNLAVRDPACFGTP